MTPVRQFAIVVGAVLTLIGILGYIGLFVSGGETEGFYAGPGLLFGAFAINAWHNLVHLGSGILGLVAGAVSHQASRLYAQVFGVVYGLIALAGLFNPAGILLLGFLPLNLADTFLHLLIALAALYFGFAPAMRERAL